MAPDQRQRHEAVADAVVLGTGNPEPGATSSCLMGLAVGWGRQMPNPDPSWNRVTNAPASRGPPEDKMTVHGRLSVSWVLRKGRLSGE